MTHGSDETVRELLEQSLVAWRVKGSIGRGADGAFLVMSAGHAIRIERAPPGLPFRWYVTSGDRRRGAVSLVAVLRQLRQALDPGYAASRVRVAALPLHVP